MWLRILALALAAAAAAALLASGPLTRLGLWDWRTGLALLRYGAYLGMAAAAVSILALLIPRTRKKGPITLALALVIGLAAVAVPLEFQRRARAVPPINDISTERSYEAYPDIRPIVLSLPREAAYARALAAAEAMGWEIVAREAQAGTIEAVATTFWFGFKDDVTIQVRPGEGRGTSRVDIRSRSRVGRSDAGTNARRIRAWRARLEN